MALELSEAHATITRMDWVVKTAKRGDGRLCKPLWEPWQGSRYNQVMDGIDGHGPQRTIDNRLFLTKQGGGIVGIVLTTPPIALLTVRHGLDLDAIKADESYVKVVKLAAVAVAPPLRGQGLGAQLVEHALNETRLTSSWMYGQFESTRPLEGFYRRLCPVPGLMEALIPRKDESHGSTKEVSRGASGTSSPDGGRSTA